MSEIVATDPAVRTLAVAQLKPTPSTPIPEAFEGYFAYYASNRLPESTARYRQEMRVFIEMFADRAVGTMTRDDIARYIRYMLHEYKFRGKGIRGNTLTFKLNLAKSVFKWCLEDKAVEVNPVQWRRLPTVPKEIPRRVPFTYDQYQRVLTEARTGDHQDYWPSAIIIAWHTGLRCKDVVNLRWEHDENGEGSKVDFDAEIIVARPNKRKAVRQRLEIPIEPDLLVHLQELRARPFMGWDTPWVLPLMHARATGRRDLHTHFRVIADKCGFREHSFHSFRHGFVTRLINAGVNPLTIAEMTGQTIDQVRAYAHVSNGAKRSALSLARAAMHQTSLMESGVGPGKIHEV